jgi:hypothetical protein
VTANAAAPAAPNCFKNDRLVLSLQSIIVSLSFFTFSMCPSPGPQPDPIFVSVYGNRTKSPPSHYSKRNFAKANTRELIQGKVIILLSPLRAAGKSAISETDRNRLRAFSEHTP